MRMSFWRGKKIFEMKNSLEEIKNRFHTTKEKTNEVEDAATESSCRLGVCLGIFMYFCLCIS